jgi:phage/plasmid-like protein (TIGR03299 family)
MGDSYFDLSKNVLTGFSATRPVWWLKYAEREGFTPRQYDGAIPMSDVTDLIAAWEPIETAMSDSSAVIDAVRAGLSGDDLIRAIESATVRSHKLLKASDTGEHMTVNGADHALHLYGPWLAGTVAECVGDDAQISSAGTLKSRSTAWVQIERPEVSTGPGGVRFAPYVLLSTSIDGSLATQINQSVTHTVCSNTMNIARGQGCAFKHTSGSAGKLGNYRSVMTALINGETDFKEALDKQLKTEVPDNAFERFLAAYVPIGEDDRPAKRTRSERKRQEIGDLYRGSSDLMGNGDWRGTEWGVTQAVSTWNVHMSGLRNTSGYEMSDTALRAGRIYGENMRPIRGESADQQTAKILESVL